MAPVVGHLSLAAHHLRDGIPQSGIVGLGLAHAVVPLFVGTRLARDGPAKRVGRSSRGRADLFAKLTVPDTNREPERAGRPGTRTRRSAATPTSRSNQLPLGSEFSGTLSHLGKRELVVRNPLRDSSLAVSLGPVGGG